MSIYLKLFLFSFLSTWISLGTNVTVESDDTNLTCWRPWCNKILKKDFKSFYNETAKTCIRQNLLYKEFSMKQNKKNKFKAARKLKALRRCCRCSSRMLLMESIKKIDGEKREKDGEWNRGLPGISIKSKHWQQQQPSIKTHSPHLHYVINDDINYEANESSHRKRIKRSIQLNQNREPPTTNENARKRPRKQSLVPMFENRTYHVTINENSPPATAVLLLQATMVDSRMKMRTASTNEDYKHSSHGNDAEASTEEEDGDDDHDRGDVIRYRLENDEYDSFAIDSKTGLITVKDPRKLDYEATSRLKVMVIAEAGMSCDFVTLWIHLRDVNDNSPQFARDKYVSAVYEGLPVGSYVTQISAEDKDSGLNSRLSYHIISGNTNHAFTISPSNTGIIKTDAVLDREERDFYRLEVEVRDQGSVQKSGRAVLRIQVVDVNDNEPKFQDIKDVVVSEASESNSIVIQLMASDDDLNTTFAFSIVNQTNHHPSDWLSFKTDSTNKMSTSLSQGVDRLSHEPYFDVEKSSGKIRIIRKLDRELFNKHVLIVEVSDGSLNSIGSLNVFVLDANDNPPLFNFTNYEISVLELTKVNSLVSSIVAHDDDVDENSLIAYELIGSDLFRIDKNTGNIYTNQNVTLRKGQGSHVIDAVVKATDRGIPPLSSVVPVRFTLVDVNNHPPIFTSESYSIEVPEDEKVDARPLLKLSSSDDDLNESNTRTFYSICRTGSSENGGSYFRLDSKTGELFLARSLDREMKDFHRLLVKVSNSLEDDHDDDNDDDDGCVGYLELQGKNGRKKNEVESSLSSHPPLKSFNSTLHSFAIVNVKVLDVNDNAPKFAEDVYRATLPEDSSIDASVLRLMTFDEDFDQKVVYSIIGGNDDNMFLLNPATGLLGLRMKLDYELRSQYILSIEAKDTGSPSLSSHCSVEISITDVNEFRPIFSNILYIGLLQEGSPADTLVFTVRATDRDAGLYGMVHYKLVCLTEHPDSPDLQINPVTGQVRMRSAVTLPLDGHSTFNYLVVAEDAGGLNATVSAVITVEAMPSTKRKLRFENASYHFQLPGNSAAGSAVGRVSVVKNSARDDGGYVFVEYHFLHGNDLFAINSTSGEIFLRVDLKLVSLSEGLSHLLEDGRDYDDEDVRKRKDKRHFQFNGVAQSFDGNMGSKARRQNKLMKRSAIITSSHFETVQLTVVAEWNYPEKERATTDLKIDVDRSCDGCSLEPLVGRVKDGSLSRSHTVTLVAFFLGIFFVMAAVAVVMVMRHRRCRKPKKSGVVSMESDHVTNRCSSINTTLAIPSPPPFLNGRNCRSHSSHVSPRHPSPVLSTSRTDEEVRLINTNRFTPPPNHQSINEKCLLVKAADDDMTNDVHPDDCCDVNESFSHDDYHTTSPQVECMKPRIENETLKLLGNMEELFLAGKLPLSPSSMESIHLFSEEGGGESGWIGMSNIKNDVQSHFASANSKIKPKDYFLPKWLLNVETNNNDDDNLNINEASRNPSSQDRPLPLGVFRLVECLPDYHSLSDVYDEIAKLRDQKSMPTPKLKPTKIVVSTGDDQGIEKLSRFYPPPILTDAPPPCWVHQRETWADAPAPLKGHV